MDRRLTLKIVFGVLLFALTKVSYSQTNSSDISPAIASTEFQARRVLPPSPDAASLGKYGNVPVSLFTGTPQISIPLYSIKENSIEIPISLSYHASGFKPEEVASWVGLGWSLSAGGVITRSAIGNPDVEPYYFNNTTDYTTLFAQTDLFARNTAFQNMKKGYIESQPDVYYYNFAGKSGKFYIKPDGTVIKKEKDNLKITHCITCFTNAQPNNSSFTIVDEKGNVYEFKEVEVSTTTYDQSMLPLQPGEEPGLRSFTYPSAWYLTKITSADGAATINFDYYTSSSAHTQYVNYLTYESVTYYTSTEPTGSVGSPGSNGCATLICQANNGGQVFGSSSRGTAPTVSIVQKYLKTISVVENGETKTKIDFSSAVNQRLDLDHNYNNDERLFTGLTVSRLDDNGNYGQIKKWALSYSYFTGTQDVFDQKRLRLDQVQEIPNDNVTTAPPPYVFTYNSGITPSLSTSGKDHWGFYNQATNLAFGFSDPTLIPTVAPERGFGANRDADFTGSAMNMLTRITYPTGGYSAFAYELNDATIGGVYTSVGGIRIKSITDYAFLNQKATQKNYYYQLPDGSSSGNSTLPIYTSSNSFHHYPTNVKVDCSENASYCGENLNWDKIYYAVSASPVSGLGTYQGSHVAYSRVTEVQTDVNSTATLGKTIYSYQIGDMSTPNNDDIRTGDLLETRVQDNNGKDLKVITNTYSYQPNGSMVAASIRPYLNQNNKSILVAMIDQNGAVVSYGWYGFWESLPAPCTGCTVSSMSVPTRYDLAGYFVTGTDRQLVQQTEKTFDQVTDKYTVVTRNLTYGNPAHTFPTLVEESTTGNEIVGTINKYAGDFSMPTNATLDNTSRGIQLLQSKNMLGAEIEKIQYRVNNDGTQKRYINGEITTYSDLFPYPSNLYRIETASPLNEVQSTSITSAGTFAPDPSYKQLGSFSFQNNGNLLEQAKAFDMTKTYVWDDRAGSPTAEVVNAVSGSVAYTSFENKTQNGYWALGNATASNYLSDALTGKQSFQLTVGVAIMRHNLSPARGYVVSYWSKNGPANVQADNASVSPASIITKNGWTCYEHTTGSNPSTVTITGTNVTIDELKLFPISAQMTTYTYDPIFGLVNTVTPNNLETSFEYDGLNRLVAVKNGDGDIVKSFKYNFGLGSAIPPSEKTLFENALQTLPFTKNDGCPVGARPTTLYYSIAAATYISSVSQEDADNKAIAEINLKGQAYANTHGQCLFYNAAKTKKFFKNNCSADQGVGLAYNYTVPADKYTSPDSQEAADALAQQDIDAYGQAFANQYAGCSCSNEGTKFINGSCVTGVKVIDESLSLGNGQYKCTYHYYFGQDNSITPPYVVYQTSPCPVQ